MKLTKLTAALLILCGSLAIRLVAMAQQPAEHPDVTSGRTARDRASIKDLQLLVEKTRNEAKQTKRYEEYARLALLNLWLCEAIESHDDKALFKKVAEDGVAAAKRPLHSNHSLPKHSGCLAIC